MRVCLTIPIATPHSISISRTQKRCSCVYLLLGSSELICYIRDAWIYLCTKKRARKSEDNANTYFEPLFLMSTTYSIACYMFAAILMYDSPQYPFLARTSHGMAFTLPLALVILLLRCIFCFCFSSLSSSDSTVIQTNVTFVYTSITETKAHRLVIINTPSRDIYSVHYTETHELTMFNLIWPSNAD